MVFHQGVASSKSSEHRPLDSVGTVETNDTRRVGTRVALPVVTSRSKGDLVEDRPVGQRIDKCFTAP